MGGTEGISWGGWMCGCRSGWARGVRGRGRRRLGGSGSRGFGRGWGIFMGRWRFERMGAVWGWVEGLGGGKVEGWFLRGMD